MLFGKDAKPGQVDSAIILPEAPVHPKDLIGSLKLTSSAEFNR